LSGYAGAGRHKRSGIVGEFAKLLNSMRQDPLQTWILSGTWNTPLSNEQWSAIRRRLLLCTIFI